MKYLSVLFLMISMECAGQLLCPPCLIDDECDLVGEQITTSKTAYDAAADNDWVSVTAAEYANIAALTGVARVSSPSTIGDIQTIAATNQYANSRTHNTGEYLVGFEVMVWSGGGNTHELKAEIDGAANFQSVGTIDIANTINAKQYFIKKKSSFLFPVNGRISISGNGSSSLNVGGADTGSSSIREANLTSDQINDFTQSRDYYYSGMTSTLCPVEITVSIVSVVNLSCGAGTGSIDITPSGGDGSYTYLWSNGATSQDVTGLSVGAYTVTVTDGLGLTGTAAATISDVDDLVGATSTSPPVCGSSNGSIDLTPSGGTGSYTYLWSNGATTQDISSLAAGTYTVDITSGTCTETVSATISDSDDLAVAASVNNAACGSTTGGIDITPSGGTGSYTYAWSNGATTQDISGVAPATYSVTVTSGTCSETISRTIGSTDNLAVGGSVTQPTCPNNTGDIDITPTGGTGSYTYSWSNGATTQDLTGVAPATYTVTVTSGTCSETYSATLTDASPCTDCTVAASISASVCDITVNVSGSGLANYTFDLGYRATCGSGSYTTVQSGVTNGTVYSSTVDGEYKLFQYGSNGCSDDFGIATQCVTGCVPAACDCTGSLAWDATNCEFDWSISGANCGNYTITLARWATTTCSGSANVATLTGTSGSVSDAGGSGVAAGFVIDQEYYSLRFEDNGNGCSTVDNASSCVQADINKDANVTVNATSTLESCGASTWDITQNYGTPLLTCGSCCNATITYQTYYTINAGAKTYVGTITADCNVSANSSFTVSVPTSSLSDGDVVQTGVEYSSNNDGCTVTSATDFPLGSVTYQCECEGPVLNSGSLSVTPICFGANNGVTVALTNGFVTSTNNCCAVNGGQVTFTRRLYRNGTLILTTTNTIFTIGGSNTQFMTDGNCVTDDYNVEIEITAVNDNGTGCDLSSLVGQIITSATVNSSGACCGG